MTDELTPEEQADIDRALTLYRNRKTYGWYYFETSRPRGGKPETVKPPKPVKAKASARRHTMIDVERWADDFEKTLAVALAGLMIRQERAERLPTPEGMGATHVTDHHSRTWEDIPSAAVRNGQAS